MLKKPRKSPRLNKFLVVVDSTPKICSRPSFELNEFTQLSDKVCIREANEFSDRINEKLLEVHYPHDNDFKDEIPLSKRLRVNNDHTFILSFPPKYSYIPKDHFLCGDSGQYITYPWGKLSFFNLQHSISSQMEKDSDYVKFEGFPLALQIWFYECYNKLDVSIAIRTSNQTPRIFNWDISKKQDLF
ncbi:hypothetical protein H5410_001950 [Solanum commersonii]|uniref:Uncharacterized protein n=1 Tax=Solanum commersonii TaxID=4109 RepID=A0A9J6B0L7_SOLCO|nr:hypothetical protein H5410_001950 [Solanum commersonii]